MNFRKRGAQILWVTMICSIWLSDTLAQISLLSPDSSSSLNIRTGLHIRYEFQEIENQSDTWRFSLARARLQLGGQAFTKGLDYFIQLTADPNSREASLMDPNKTLLDAWIRYSPTPWLKVQAGQFRIPALRQGYTSIMLVQLTDRSQLSRTFAYNRDVGLMINGKFDISGLLLKPYFSVTSGEGQNLVDIAQNQGNQFVLRLELLTGGEFKSNEGFMESDPDREGHPKGAIAVAREWNHDPLRSNGNTGNYLFDSQNMPFNGTITTWMADAALKYKGFFLLFEYLDRKVHRPEFLAGNGFNLQVSYLFINNLELAIRHSRLNLAGVDHSPVEQNLGIIQYFRRHDLKLQGELIRVTPLPDREEWAFRLQLSLRT